MAEFLYRKNQFELLIYTHVFYLILGVAVVFGASDLVAYLNASPVILDSGRISVTELEPSVATLRPGFILFVTYIIFSYNRKVSSVTVYILTALVLFVLFNIKSKSIIFILPLSILFSTMLVVLIAKGKLVNKVSILLTFIPVGLIASHYILQSEYFTYAFHFTFVDVSGSSLSRLLFAQTGVNLFVNNPFGYGVTYYPFFKEELLNVISINNFILNEELLYMQSDGDMSSLFSPKSGLLTWSVNGGVVLILAYLVYSFSIVRNCLRTNLNSKLQIAIISSIIFFVSFSMISEINASFVLYFGILTGMCRLIIRESNGKLN
ncbi:hypothetical protein [Shewanella acanthi]|uniref:hypothetical protein n=1 Tax=Shewanella acanthi TaxID=2864212 RepID=UPI001C65C154|nr:hypothetical protein [Shewanella acanthi]QYJ79925.1 hypothetical protein K0H61_05780 [Shewanella acanthi]